MDNTNTSIIKASPTGIALVAENPYELQAFTQLSKAHQEIVLATKEKKFIDFDEKDKQKLAQNIFSWMVLLQIKEKPEASDGYYKIMVLFLIKSFPDLTLSEFKLAIGRGVSGVSNQKGRHFQSFGADYISMLINEYLSSVHEVKFDYKRAATKIEQDALSKLTEEQRQLMIWKGLLSVVENYLKNGSVIDIGSGMYYYLKNHNEYGEVLKKYTTEEGIIKAMEQARAEETKRLENAKYKTQDILKIKSFVAEQQQIAAGDNKATEQYLHAVARKIITAQVFKDIDLQALKSFFVDKINNTK